MNKYLSRPWLAFVLIALTTAVIYSNIYHASFVFDDITSIVENKKIRDASNYFSLVQLIRPRAIVDLTFALNYEFGRLNVFGYHLVNIIIHLLNGFLVYFLALTIFMQLSKLQDPVISSKSEDRSPLSTPANPDSMNRLKALMAALIFAAHPLQTQAVTYTAQRYASMAALFYLASLLFYLKARIIQQRSKEQAAPAVQSKKKKAKTVPQTHTESKAFIGLYALSFFCGVLAFLSKQNTATLPLTILLAEYLLIDRTRQGWKKKLPWIGGLLMVFMIFVLSVSAFFQGGPEGRGLLEDVSRLMAETETVSRWSYLCTQFNVLVIYIRLLFLPVGQNLDYLYPFKSGFFDGLTPAAFLFLAGIIAIGVWSLKKRPLISFSIFGFFIALSVESSIVPIKDALFEHRLYLPMFSFALLMAELLFQFFLKKRTLVHLAMVLMILSLGTATYLRNRVWRDGITLWSDVVSKNPKNQRAHNNLGVELFDINRIPEAINHYLTALQINPADVSSHNNLGNALNKQGLKEKAIEHYLIALRIDSTFKKAHINLGNILNERGQNKGAIDYFLAALRGDRNNKEALVGLGNALQGQRKIADAIDKYDRALQIDPDFKEAHYNLGVALFTQNRTEEAIYHYSKALQTDPNDPAILTKLGSALQRQGKAKEAEDQYLRAIKIDPEFSQAYFNLGTSFQEQGRIPEAAEYYIKTLRIDPVNKAAHFNLGNILLAHGRADEAVAHYNEAIRSDPDFFEAHNNLAAALMRIGNIDEAILHFKEVLRITPDNVNARRNLDRAMARRDRNK
ncbi:MAG: tetratricopeptide repeat protein [Desulfobacterales bacterium]|nr:tetratricopeptide repeat protein [Desulfobacterales bacterium]